MIEINREECIGCGACIKDCPANAIKLTEERAEYYKDCIHCGHCVAICPVNAVSIPEYEMSDVEEYDPETFHVNPEQYLHAVKFRRSVRDFKKTPLEREKVERILKAGRYTATAKNMQGCRFVFVQEGLEEFKDLVWEQIPAVLEELKKTAPVYAKYFHYLCERRKRNREEDGLFFNTTSLLVIASANPLDGGLAASNVENMAVAEGAGVLYDGYLQRVIEAIPAAKEWLGIEELPVACCMLMGYPAVKYRRTAPRRAGDIVWK